MKIVREHINEKFSNQSDPIKDMSIGMLNVRQDFESDEDLYKFVCQYLIPHIIHSDNIKSIINTDEEPRLNGIGIIKDPFFARIFQYCNTYLRVNGYKAGINGHDLKQHIMYDKLQESFTEDSDPVKDIGIGIPGLIKDSSKKIFELDQKFLDKNEYSFVNKNVQGTIIESIVIRENSYFLNMYGDRVVGRKGIIFNKVTYCRKLIKGVGLDHLFKTITGFEFDEPDSYQGVKCIYKKNTKKYFQKFIGKTINSFK